MPMYPHEEHGNVTHYPASCLGNQREACNYTKQKSQDEKKYPRRWLWEGGSKQWKYKNEGKADNLFDERFQPQVALIRSSSRENQPPYKTLKSYFLFVKYSDALLLHFRAYIWM
ncbi:hypothetical protein I3842_13G018200 [Carya illinoinensis]|uniref:Uncharacterized protein n=1 Tax=Carya illinoinensis TaxID=32201 RepID=A0A922D5B9_CARIL|nr:hypothetical protein I3842_13G018200 [Carya illinoinensis]